MINIFGNAEAIHSDILLNVIFIIYNKAIQKTFVGPKCFHFQPN